MVFVPSDKVTVISHSLTSKCPDTGLPEVSTKLIFSLMAPSLGMSSSDHSLESKVLVALITDASQALREVACLIVRPLAVKLAAAWR